MGDNSDALPFNVNEYEDNDNDGIGNISDLDDDNDGILDLADSHPFDDTLSGDSDGDGLDNLFDHFPEDASEQYDSDFDGVGDNADVFPNDPTETLDFDMDGIGNNADLDDDNDGVEDLFDLDPLNALLTIIPDQILSVADNTNGVGGFPVSVVINYETSDSNNKLTGLGFRMHFDSNILDFQSITNVLEDGFIFHSDVPEYDFMDLDNDPQTNAYVSFGFAGFMDDWPNKVLPTSLASVNFDVVNNLPLSSAMTRINFTEIESAEGYNLSPISYEMDLLPALWDFDKNGVADALTDGLLLLRYAFGLRGEFLTRGAYLNDDLTSSDVEQGVVNALEIADIDRDGSINALTDGLLLLRYLFGVRGESLLSQAITNTAQRTTVDEIEEHLEKYMP